LGANLAKDQLSDPESCKFLHLDYRATGLRILPELSCEDLLMFSRPIKSGLVFDPSSPLFAQTITVLHAFTGGEDGGQPMAGVVEDSRGNLYGTTHQGGKFGVCPIGCGVVYKVSPSAHETVIHLFTGGADGANPAAGLIFDSAGNLYGTTS
jgi:uncharacterized repeat protein (TIGR03803 family)